MAVTIDYGNTDVIFVPKADLTLVSGTLYSYDTEAFRLELKALEAGENGMAFTDTHIHNTEVTLSGVTYARFIEIIPPYTVEFEDAGGAPGQYTVVLTGSNHNIGDPNISVQNQVKIITNNSAGLIKGGLGSVVEGAHTAEDILRILLAVATGISDSSNPVIFRDEADAKDRVNITMTGSDRTTINTLDGT